MNLERLELREVPASLSGGTLSIDLRGAVGPQLTVVSDLGDGLIRVGSRTDIQFFDKSQVKSIAYEGTALGSNWYFNNTSVNDFVHASGFGDFLRGGHGDFSVLAEDGTNSFVVGGGARETTLWAGPGLNALVVPSSGHATVYCSPLDVLFLGGPATVVGKPLYTKLF